MLIKVHWSQACKRLQIHLYFQNVLEGTTLFTSFSYLGWNVPNGQWEHGLVSYQKEAMSLLKGCQHKSAERKISIPVICGRINSRLGLKETVQSQAGPFISAEIQSPLVALKK